MTLKNRSLRKLVIRTTTLALLLGLVAVSPSQAGKPAGGGTTGDQAGRMTRVTFLTLSIPLGGIREFASTTFTAPVSGTALLRGRYVDPMLLPPDEYARGRQCVVRLLKGDPSKNPRWKRCR